MYILVVTEAQQSQYKNHIGHIIWHSKRKIQQFLTVSKPEQERTNQMAEIFKLPCNKRSHKKECHKPQTA